MRLPSESLTLKSTQSLWYEVEGGQRWWCLLLKTKQRKREEAVVSSVHPSTIQEKRELYTKFAEYLSSLRPSWIGRR